MEKEEPTYALSWIQYKLAAGRYRVERLAMRGALEMGFDEQDIVTCVSCLTCADFHKSMESETRPGLWQDVYRPFYEGEQVYLKLQIDATTDAVIIQFKRK